MQRMLMLIWVMWVEGKTRCRNHLENQLCGGKLVNSWRGCANLLKWNKLMPRVYISSGSFGLHRRIANLHLERFFSHLSNTLQITSLDSFSRWRQMSISYSAASLDWVYRQQRPSPSQHPLHSPISATISPPSFQRTLTLA